MRASNRRFYDDKLIVFPSPLDPDKAKRERKLGVFHHRVGGKYKSSLNIPEAQAVAEAAVAFMRDDPDRSLGVVTLNQAQREVLLSEIDRLVARDRSAAVRALFSLRLPREMGSNPRANAHGVSIDRSYWLFRQSHLIFSGKRTEAVGAEKQALQASERREETRGGREQFTPPHSIHNDMRAQVVVNQPRLLAGTPA
jgi:hypothetical protein